MSNRTKTYNSNIKKDNLIFFGILEISSRYFCETRHAGWNMYSDFIYQLLYYIILLHMHILEWNWTKVYIRAIFVFILKISVITMPIYPFVFFAEKKKKLNYGICFFSQTFFSTLISVNKRQQSWLFIGTNLKLYLKKYSSKVLLLKINFIKK